MKSMKENDKQAVISKEDLHGIGIKKLISHLKKDNYEILEFNINYGLSPSIIAKKDEEILAIDVEVDIYPKHPKIKLDRKYALINYCRGYSTKPYYASICLGSANKSRNKSGIILYGDSIVFDFRGLESIEKKLPKINTKDYYIYAMQFIGNNLMRNKVKEIDTFLSDSVIISDNLKDTETENVIVYLEKFINKYKVESYDIIRSVGYFKYIYAKNLFVNGENKENVNVKILQDPNKINLLLSFPDNENDINLSDVVLNFNFAEDGKISKIEIINPNLYNFVHYDNYYIEFNYPNELTDKVLNGITLDDVIVYSDSMENAQGTGNQIEAYIKNGDSIILYTGVHSDSKESKLTTKKILDFFKPNSTDELDDIGWEWFNLGLGNGLYVRNKYYDLFQDKYDDVLEFPFIMYSTWKKYFKFLFEKEFNNYIDEALLDEIDNEIDDLKKQYKIEDQNIEEFNIEDLEDELDSDNGYVCNNCGADVDEDDEECPCCGVKFIEEADESDVEDIDDDDEDEDIDDEDEDEDIDDDDEDEDIDDDDEDEDIDDDDEDEDIDDDDEDEDIDDDDEDEDIDDDDEDEDIDDDDEDEDIDDDDEDIDDDDEDVFNNLTKNEIAEILDGDNFAEIVKNSLKKNIDSIFELSNEDIIDIIFNDSDRYAHRIISVLEKNNARKFLMKMDGDYSSEFLMYSIILHMIYTFEVCMRVEKIDQADAKRFNEIIKGLLLRNSISYAGNNYSLVEKEYLRFQSQIVSAINNMGGQGIPLNITYSLVNSICDRNKINYSLFGRKNFTNFMDDTQRLIIKFMQKYTEK